MINNKVIIQMLYLCEYIHMYRYKIKLNFGKIFLQYNILSLVTAIFSMKTNITIKLYTCLVF